MSDCLSLSSFRRLEFYPNPMHVGFLADMFSVVVALELFFKYSYFSFSGSSPYCLINPLALELDI